ncbi:tonB-system energizer ExbB [Amaricoccus sp.]|uniref:tonB-system energizer ExbB n=1 Tax=Amaricoccus sp. TaxID=1872485 RepID=UPI00261D9413|nr:tonB-system energizer ExbB [Amaricoccus sp.]HRO12296.1 tonB-system energizer ExbB [Amaricoccus sp.]
MGRVARAAVAVALVFTVAAGATAAQDAPAVPEALPAMPAAESAPAQAAEAPATAPGARAPAADERAGGSAVLLAPDGALDAPGTGALPRDLSPWGMYMAADVVVKGVMIGLALASLATWTVCLAKSLELLAAGSRLNRGLRVILGARDLAAADRALAGQGGPAAAMVRVARHEASVTAPDARQGLLPRVASHLSRIEAGAGRRLSMGTGILATIGSTAPFVGLFGTVWGIMNSFIGISETQTTNLAVVAPGIAEALLATALGLVAAIPAVVIYNVFARWIAGYRARLADAAAGVERLVSRDLDHDRLAPAPLARAAE